MYCNTDRCGESQVTVYISILCDAHERMPCAHRIFVGSNTISNNSTIAPPHHDVPCWQNAPWMFRLKEVMPVALPRGCFHRAVENE